MCLVLLIQKDLLLLIQQVQIVTVYIIKLQSLMEVILQTMIISSYLDLSQTTQYRDINKFTIPQNGGETIIIYALHLESDGHNGNTGSPQHRSAEISYLLDIS